MNLVPPAFVTPTTYINELDLVDSRPGSSSSSKIVDILDAGKAGRRDGTTRHPPHPLWVRGCLSPRNDGGKAGPRVA